VPSPAVYDDKNAFDCQGRHHVVSTAYLPRTSATSSLLLLYLSRDGTIEKKSQAVVMTPAGVFRTLVLIVNHPETVGPNGLALLADGQRQVNEDHATFAHRRNYDTPLVEFANTNIVIAKGDLAAPRDPRAVRAWARRRIGDTVYHLIIVINLDPTKDEGGFAAPDTNSVYVGNFGQWDKPLDAVQWSAVANTAYHHEVAHLWGWSHDWSPTCGGVRSYDPFMAPPILFGWEDVDGDGVPEILDKTPYGRGVEKQAVVGDKH
jgi:hypothetical protein